MARGHRTEGEERKKRKPPQLAARQRVEAAACTQISNGHPSPHAAPIVGPVVVSVRRSYSRGPGGEERSSRWMSRAAWLALGVCD